MTLRPRATFAWRAASVVLPGVLLLQACGGDDAPPPASNTGDPLAGEQWHLENRGQTAFAAVGGRPGVDLNVRSAHDGGVFGQGVPVLVADSGLEVGHEDLAANVDPAMLHSYDRDAPRPSDPTPWDNVAHGTAVAGIIGAVRDNGVGGMGVAPEARLGAVRMLCDGQPNCSSDVHMVEIFGGADYSRGAWVINGSFGSEPGAPEPLIYEQAPVMLALEGLAGLRDGRGALFVKSAGNSFRSTRRHTPGVDYCGPANAVGLSCHMPIADSYGLPPTVLLTAAVNAAGAKSSYSSAGSSVFVSGLGGEFGVGAGVAPSAPQGPAIVTTDLSGCGRGDSGYDPDGDYTNAFQDPATSVARQYNVGCRYTATMNGTSSAAPTVSGVIALMLGVNPELGWRDIRDILARTSRADLLKAPPGVTLPMADGEFVADPGWQENAVGLWHSAWYGYGLVDAEAAVAAARAIPGGRLLGPLRGPGWLVAGEAGPALPVPPGQLAGAERSIDVNEPLVVESVIVQVKTDGTAPMGDLAVEVLSPSGTPSVLMTPHNMWHNNLASAGSSGILLTTEAFYGEPGQGAWRIRLVDLDTRGATESGATLGEVRLLVRGH